MTDAASDRPGDGPTGGPARQVPGQGSGTRRRLAAVTERRGLAAVTERRQQLAGVGGRAGSLEAPHRRAQAGPRIIERVSIRAYRGASWLLAHVPARLAWTVIGVFVQASYVFWSKKRRWVNANFAHVLDQDADSVAVRRLALRAYRNYARYLVELMRLPNLPHDVAVGQVDTQGMATLEGIWRAEGSVILVAAHVGNNEAVAAGLAWKGFPINVVADDSAFPEMFEMLRRQREAWGVRLIPWRNLRETYRVLRTGEILALLVDWGYRSDGIPVRLFGAWTTLPAGPAVLAARSGATILPIVARRNPDGRFLVTHDEPIRVASSEPAELARATQAIADALERTIAAAPEQWYSFKPLWPETPAESERLAAIAASRGLPRLSEATEGAGAGGR
ncbi:MAG TPA: lysophospholipid acyltransferase family protein [Candidatus Limnocylindrales bacterium]